MRVRPTTASLSRRLVQPLISSRGHKTTARTKRSLKIPPHDSFLPSRTNPPTKDTIIYNPPSSEASPHHTPFLFLPRSDPRRLALIRSRGISSTSSAAAAGSGTTTTGQQDFSNLPPELRYKRREPKSHMTIEDIREMKRLRAADPLTWSANALARKFKCSPIFVSVCAPAPKEHLHWLESKMDKKASRWGPKKTQAKEERKMRTELMYQGKL